MTFSDLLSHIDASADQDAAQLEAQSRSARALMREEREESLRALEEELRTRFASEREAELERARRKAVLRLRMELLREKECLVKEAAARAQKEAASWPESEKARVFGSLMKEAVSRFAGDVRILAPSSLMGLARAAAKHAGLADLQIEEGEQERIEAVSGNARMGISVEETVLRAAENAAPETARILFSDES